MSERDKRHFITIGICILLAYLFLEAEYHVWTGRFLILDVLGA